MAKILVLFECSGIVSTAFYSAGNYVLSCDLQDSPFFNHYIGDYRQVQVKGFDLVIAFPPCEQVSTASGRKWLLHGFEIKQLDALSRFNWLINLPVKYICIENPRSLLSRFYPASQEIHPYYFGDNYKKRTRLWLKNLPLLVHTQVENLFENKTHVEPKYSLVYSSKGSKKRSKFHIGVANAMVQQWNKIINS